MSLKMDKLKWFEHKMIHDIGILMINMQSILLMFASITLIYTMWIALHIIFDITVISLIPSCYLFTGYLDDSVIKLTVFLLTCFLSGCLLIWRREKDNVSG